MEFAVGEYVLLKVSPLRGMRRFGQKKLRKLSPRFIRPFLVVAKIGAVAYRLDLPPPLGDIHNVFHVSMLRRFVPDPSHVIRHEEIQILENASYQE